MTVEIKDEDDDEDDWGSIDSEDEDDDRALRGFRFMFNMLAAEPNAQEDELEEDEDDEEEEATAAAEDEGHDGDRPSPDYITQKLSEQGVTMAQLVKVMLTSHDEYSNEESFDRIDDKIYGKLRIIISNYRPEPVVVQEIVVATPMEPVDFDAQPKSSRVTSRRMMSHL
jgi:hypothetical protein